MKLLPAPLPILLAALEMQLPADLLQGAPQWAVAAAVIVFVTIYALNQFGLLRNGERRKRPAPAPSFTADDRSKLQKLHSLHAHRGEDGVERWLVHRIESKEAFETLAKLLEETNEKLARLVVLEEQRR